MYFTDHLNRHIKEVHRNDKSGLYKRRRKPKDTPKEDVKVTTANPVTDEMFTNDEALQVNPVNLMLFMGLGVHLRNKMH